MNFAKLYSEHTDYIKGPIDADWSVTKAGNLIKIRFDGTKSFRDFIQDIKFFEKEIVPYENCKLKFHAGFYEAYKAVRNSVLDACYNLYTEGNSFLICGHSLGGAMAAICVEDIWFHFKQNPTLITWGHPRITKDLTTQNFIGSLINSESKMFINGSDVVPHLPFLFWKDFKRTRLGRRFNFFKGWWDIISLKFNYHCGYGNEELYKDI